MKPLQKKKSGIDRTVYVVILTVLSIIMLLFTVAIQIWPPQIVPRPNPEYPAGEEDALRRALDEANQVKQELQNQLDHLLTNLSGQLESLDENDDPYARIESLVGSLSAQIREKNEEIARLQADIALLQHSNTTDWKGQTEILEKLADLLAHPVMIVREVTVDVPYEVTLENGTKETRTVAYTYQKEEAPALALYYEDITTGYSYAFQADRVFDSASLIKAPFALSILQAATEEAEYRSKLLQTKKEEDLPEAVYDLNKVYIYHKDTDFRTGSGTIVKGEDGAKYTYLELFRYLLRYSDNVAFYQIKQRFGTNLLFSMVRQKEWKSMYDSLSNMSAADGGRIMKEIYAFCNKNGPYAALLRGGLIGSAHQLLTVSAYYGKTVAHKYGWAAGAYHDMAIVYGTYPFVVSVMSNYDMGGKEVNDYLVSLLQCVGALHDSFHALEASS